MKFKPYRLRIVYIGIPILGDHAQSACSKLIHVNREIIVLKANKSKRRSPAHYILRTYVPELQMALQIIR